MLLRQATWASAWSLAIVCKGNQGGHLHRCRHSLCTCILTLVFFSVLRFSSVDVLRFLSVVHNLSHELTYNLCPQMSVF